MSKTLYDRYDKQNISNLPTVGFTGRIFVVVGADECHRAVDYLLRQPLLGLDTETRPSFTRGHQHKVSLLQVSTDMMCFLFRLNYLGMNEDIIRLLEDTTVTKVGLSWHDDLTGLLRLGKFKPGKFIDIQDIVGRFGIQDLSLLKLYANVFGQRLNKRQQLSNWERDILDDKQKLYAATDAWACLMLYREFQRLEATGDYELITTEQQQQ